MPTYAVEFTKSARKEIKKLDSKSALRIITAIDKLAKNPRKGNVRPMVGSKSWRLRAGTYRVIYDIHDKKLIVLIVRVRHRGEIYKGL